MKKRKLDTANTSTKRPHSAKIVTQAFCHGNEMVALVMVCGPRSMGRAFRDAVAPWVMRGRKVVWHEEALGW